jgi:D-glycero-D-manno-heptose 1,7-bisphosphate phosphatase
MSFVILDRDGVVNHDSDEYIKSPEEWVPIAGSLEAIAQLNRHEVRVVIATNQSGVARGYYDVAMLDCIHEKFMHELAIVGGCIEEIFFCPHHPDEKCACRKPNPGLIYQAEKKYSLNLAETFLIGDSITDIRAARAAGCLPILVLTGNGKRTLTTYSEELLVIPKFANLAEAVSYIIAAMEKHGKKESG